MADHHDTHAHTGHSHGTVKQLMTGFVLAAILTIIPFGLVMADTGMNRMVLGGIIMVLAAAQIIVHLVYFLHVNRSAEQGWTVAGTLLAVIILVIIIIGSLWVMHNMNTYMMPPMDHGTPAPAAPAAVAPMDHSNMPGMDHSNMPGMQPAQPAGN